MQGEVCPHPPLRRHLPPRGKAGNALSVAPAGPIRKQRLPGFYGPSGLHEAKDGERIARRK